MRNWYNTGFPQGRLSWTKDKFFFDLNVVQKGIILLKFHTGLANSSDIVNKSIHLPLDELSCE